MVPVAAAKPLGEGTLILTNAAPELQARHRTLELLGENVIARG